LKREVFSVYVITNLSNGMKYVGMSKNLQQRWNNHKNANYNTSKLHCAIREEGIDNFEMLHLADAFTRKDAELLEQAFITENKSRYPNGYNQTDGGFMFGGIPYITRTSKKANDVVFPNGNFAKVIYPNNFVYYSSSSGWIHKDLPIGEIGIYLTLIIDKKEVEYKLMNELKIKKEIL
jgi:group I intron endonuclease